MKRFSCLLLSGVSMFSLCTTLAAPPPSSASDSLALRLRRQLELFPQEKIFLHTDKPYYMAGDTLWFRAHVVDASTHVPADASRYVYVDFRCVDNPPVGTAAPAAQHYRILERDGVYAGYIPLPMTLESGNYELTAYTHFMRNLPHDYFFRQSVYVSAYGQRYAPGKQEAVADYDVTFHPEGGYFIEGVRCTAGFKALRADGVSADITGQIVDETGREVARFASRHAGMGKCTFTPEAGHRYTAVCRDAAGTERRVRLPEAEQHTCVLQVYPASERFTVQAAAASAYDPGALRLLIHCRGNVCYNGVLDPVTRQASFRWEDFPQGVLQILLLDEGMRTLSERLLFHYDPELEATARIHPDKPEYGRREKVCLELEFRDAEGDPLTGNVSLSVTDSRIIDPDFAHRDIRTELLLESELRGYVEDPDYYLGERTPERMAAADALMLTQGWRRYDIPKVLQGVYAEPELPLEIGQEITGRLEKTGLFRGRNFKGYAVSALVPRFGAFFRAEVERDGSFALNGFDMPDSTHFVLRAEGPGGKTDVVLAADPQTWPEADAPLPRPDRRERMRRYDRSVASFTDSLKHILIEEVVVSASQKPLEPITNPYQVLARTSVDYKKIEEEGYTDLEELLMRQHGVHIRGDVVYAYGKPARYMIDGILWEPHPPVQVVDPSSEEVAYSLELETMPDFIPVEMIKKIDIIPSVNTALASYNKLDTKSLGSSIISITTKNGAELLRERDKMPDSERLNTTVLVPQGYQTPVEFYAPKYETARQRNAPERDLRTTLWWTPALDISPQGTARIEFYTADDPSHYDVRIEGVLYGSGDETGAVSGSASDGEENDAVGKPAILHRVLEL